MDQSQNDLWNLFRSESFIIDFRNILKATIEEKNQIESDKTTSDRSYKKRIKTWEERKGNLTKIIRHFSQVEGTLVTTDLIKIQDGNEDNSLE